MGSSPTTHAKSRRIYDEHVEPVTRCCLRPLGVADVSDATAEVLLVARKNIDRIPEGDITAVAGQVRESDDKAVRRLFGWVGVKPRGQKHLAHSVHTIPRWAPGRG